VLNGLPFGVLLAIGVFQLIVANRYLGAAWGTPIYPVTHLMLHSIGALFSVLLMIILAFYGGELIWRQRAARLHEIYDAMPVASWVFFAGKATALMVVAIVYLGAGIATTIGIQLYQGYDHLELPVYAQGFVVEVLTFLLVAILAVFLQVAAGKKFIGYLLMILYLLSKSVLDTFHFEHCLYRYACTPAAPYSDMNGYGHFVAPLVWFNLYWAFGAAILSVLALLLWVRGTDSGWRLRLRLAAQRFRGPVRRVLTVATVGFVATGGWIFYNTNVLNEYLPEDRVEARKAAYEKKFRRYKSVAQPRVSEVAVEVDLFPRERRLEARGRYRLVNRSGAPIADLHLNIPRRVQVNSLVVPPHREVLHDAEHGYRIYRLEQPLAAGAELELGFDVTVAHRGFVTGESDTRIVYNGSYFGGLYCFPSLGYRDNMELPDAHKRRKYGLPPLHGMAAVDDPVARRNQYAVGDADWIRFQTTISTSADQIAVAPGALEREWTVGNRRYFHYRVDGPMGHAYCFLSADYRVVRDRWEEVAIEIYHHAAHTYNLDRMLDALRSALAYYSAQFGPYPYRQLRIVEFPRYIYNARALPTTVAYSELAGFIARVGEDEIDYPFYITAHEVAHQWWGYQVVSGHVQGACMLAESLAQYSALMVMEKEYGAEMLRALLRYELDYYLAGRSSLPEPEVPLMLVEDQGYICYNKGSLAMVALRDYLGEKTLNRALARYVAAVGFQQPPYTNTLELLEFLRAATPPEQHGLLTDLFATITLFDNRIEDARCARRPDGKYAVRIRTRSRKLRADGHGVETEIPLDDRIDVGVFGPKRGGEETVLYLAKRHVTESETTFEVVVDERPVRAGIDPYNKLIDRNADDNVKRVAENLDD